MAGHKCCPAPCDEEPGGPCNCDCNPPCPECCWKVGDKVKFKHTWESYTLRRSIAASFPFHGPLCWLQDYEGGSVEVTYVNIKCATIEGEPAHIWALDTSTTSVSYNKGLAVYEAKVGNGWYPLFPKLVMLCGSGGPDPYWVGMNLGETQIFDLAACVGHCNACRGDAGASASCQAPQCLTGFEPLPCQFTAGALTSESPCWCDDCAERQDACGGMIYYCLQGDKSQYCVCTGNLYGAYAGGCDTGCEEDVVTGRWLLDECDLRSTSVLEIEPDPVMSRQCLHHIEDECCKTKKTCPPGECEDVEEVNLGEPEWPLGPTPWKCPEDYPGSCDCFTSAPNFNNCLPANIEGCGGLGKVPMRCP
jgi:hypothetical protein